jgi:hypothetical protein
MVAIANNCDCDNDRTAWICVVTIRTKTIVYLGTNLEDAATRLRPGTVYGEGKSSGESIIKARANAARLQPKLEAVYGS